MSLAWLHRINTEPKQFRTELTNDYWASRDEMLGKEFGADLQEGKDILLKVLGGKTPPLHLQSKQFIRRLQNASRMQRWLARSCMPDEYKSLSVSDKQWAEASAFAIIWQRPEATRLTADDFGDPICDRTNQHYSGAG